MKSKLMVGALFLAAFSHAATLVAPTGTSFEDRTIGEALVIGKDDAGLDAGSNYWFYGGSASELVTDCVVTIADYSGFAGEKPALAPTTDEKALLVETDTRLTRAIQVAADAKIKLDLAGHTITGGDVLDAATGEAVGCVIKVLGELMIEDSSKGKTGRVVAVAPHASIACAHGAKLTITGGTFEGEILRDGATVEIYNGSFSGSPDAFVLKDCLPDWYEYEYADGFWTVIELPMPNYYYLEIPEVPGADPIISNYDTNEPIEDTGNIREGTRVSVVWEPWEGYKIIDSAREIITMNGPKSATAPNVNPTFHVRKQNPSGCWGFAHRSSLHSRFRRVGSFA